MAIRIKIKIEHQTSVHFKGVFDDHTLCGVTTSSDDSMGVVIKNDVKQKVDCKDCIRIITYCNTISSKEYKQKQ